MLPPAAALRTAPGPHQASPAPPPPRATARPRPRPPRPLFPRHTAAGAMAALQSKRDAMQRRAEGLLKCKTEFQELAKCL
jgi:hypothetical protein